VAYPQSEVRLQALRKEIERLVKEAMNWRQQWKRRGIIYLQVDETFMHWNKETLDDR